MGCIQLCWVVLSVCSLPLWWQLSTRVIADMEITRLRLIHRFSQFLVAEAEHAVSSGRQWLQYQAFRSPMVDKTPLVP